MKKVFISYRRDECLLHAHALYGHLQISPEIKPFMDMANLQPGEAFPKILEEQIRLSSNFVLLVGKQSLRGDHTNLNDERNSNVDWVKREIVAAIGAGIPILPVLVDGARFPPSSDLPLEIRQIATINAIDLDHKQNFDASIKKIIAWINGGEAVLSPNRAQEAPRQKPSWAAASGVDKFGNWADVSIRGSTQRLRWIPPGSFLMGSPENEEEHSAGEGPQHRVSITHGFWLADSACTRDIYYSVARTLPHGFDTLPSAHPVVHVSWNDIHEQFLWRLGNYCRNLEATLPTEAEWEYACRANSSSPFSFGSNISSVHVNYDGTRPYNGAAAGRNREETVAVKSLPANSWGLYEMHGNVREWCADAPRVYRDTPEADPFGAPTRLETFFHDHKVQRGGSFFDPAGVCRSGCRKYDTPDARWLPTGFRIMTRAS